MTSRKVNVGLTAHARDDAQASLREAQSGSVADCAYISSERQFSSAAQGSAVHRSQNRHWQPRQACNALIQLEQNHDLKQNMHMSRHAAFLPNTVGWLPRACSNHAMRAYSMGCNVPAMTSRTSSLNLVISAGCWFFLSFRSAPAQNAPASSIAYLAPFSAHAAAFNML